MSKDKKLTQERVIQITAEIVEEIKSKVGDDNLAFEMNVCVLIRDNVFLLKQPISDCRLRFIAS